MPFLAKAALFLLLFVSLPVHAADPWSYLYANEAGTFPMHWDAAQSRWQGNEFVLIYPSGAHPGGRSDAVRQWTSPLAGVVEITGQVADRSTTCGDGIRAQIFADSLLLWQYDMPNGGPDQSFDLFVAVIKGSNLRFVLNRGVGGNNWCDWTDFAPTITVRTDFAKPVLLPPPTPPPPIIIDDNLRVFAYYAVRYPVMALINETAAWTNAVLFDLTWQSSDDGVWDALRANNMKAIVTPPYMFEVDPVRTSPSHTAYKLRAEWQEAWRDFEQHSGIRQHMDLVRAIYMVDEPFWNGISCDEMGKAANLMKSTFPNVPLLLVEASGPGIERLCPIQAIDWLGFDYYDVKDPRTNAAYQANLKALQAKMLPHQHMVYIMDSFYGPGHQYMGLTPADLGPIAQHYYEMAQADKRAVGILGFVWNDDAGGTEPVQGAKSLPASVLAMQQTIGKKITNK